jgi:putative transcriptional regulator
MAIAHKALKQAKPAKSSRPKPGRRAVAGRAGQGKPASDVLASVHGAVAGLHRAGVVKAATMREFDALCLLPVLPLAPAEIAALRRREKVSQPVFARYLNVSKSSVSQWEIGEKKPDGAAAKLLDLVRRKGLGALV